MQSRLAELYKIWVIERSAVVLALLGLVIVVALSQAQHFKLDASADSLTLEDDEDLSYYRAVKDLFPSSDDFLVIAVSSDESIFHPESIQLLKSLKSDLLAIESVEQINSILDVPLLHHSDLTLTNISDYLQTLEEPEISIDSAREEIMGSPMYRRLLISDDERTTAIQIILKGNEEHENLVRQRELLREKRALSELNEKETEALARADERIKELNPELIAKNREYISQIRDVMAQYREQTTLFLGGVPMIVVDMIEYVRNDLKVFGVGVLLFLACTLVVIFRSVRWVVLPLFCCILTSATMVGYIGWSRFPVTVISSNFISLLLIITMSMIIHLVVRYREYSATFPELDQSQLVLKTVTAMARPCLYTSLTTMVAFGSLLISGIRPVIDFGFMMTVGVMIAYTFAFLLFPAILNMLPKESSAIKKAELTISGKFARLTDILGWRLILAAVCLALVCLYGMSKLTVENRFIDYFKESTEIHQGMKLIDQNLGGTVPLDVVVQFDIAHQEMADEALDEGEDEDCFLDDECMDDVYGESTFFTQEKVTLIKELHRYLESLPEIGKVISIATTLEIADQIKGAPLETLELAFMESLFPDELRGLLVDPYIHQGSGQVRLAARVIESDPDLERDELLSRVRGDLVEKMGLAEDQFRLTSLVVLYNNMLQSLFTSQIKTLGFVLIAIMVMFLILFRSLKVAVVAIIPNILAPAVVLGMMGLAGLPLDIMTITIAAISVGIAVDNTIHYIYRYRAELQKDGSYRAAMFRSHGSIGRAMYYTSITIILGFSILAFSNFNPTIYFGLLTGLAMFIALLASLTLLPQLIIQFKPFELANKSAYDSSFSNAQSKT